jgi:hypothetical protein
MYAINPPAVEELRNSVRSEISALSREALLRVNISMFHRYSECI